MNGKAAKLLRKVSSVGGGGIDHLKRIYYKMNHIEKGHERLVFEQAIRDAAKPPLDFEELRNEAKEHVQKEI